MQTWYFSETAYPHLPDEASYESIRVELPNRLYDPRIGADLYHRHLDEWLLAEELGLDLMGNEHHQTATCVVPAVPIIMGILARQTTKARLLVLGNPMSNRRQPVRVAEEMAMIDVLSRGRLEVGFVRGVPYEIAAANSNPVRMTERLWEAHDLMLKAWTSHDGPFNWEGRFFHHRQVNIWPRPWQQPHPPMWFPCGSAQSAARVAGHGYVCAAFLIGHEAARRIFDGYREAWRAAGRGATPNHRLGYLGMVYVGDTDEEGRAGGEKILWYVKGNKVPPHYYNPPGYVSPELAALVALGKIGPGATPRDKMTVESQIARGSLFAGNPDTVFAQIKQFYQRVGGFGHLLMMGQAGMLDHAETTRGLRLFAKEVYPRLKELTAESAEARP